jgi:hypothetical protein
VALVAGCQQFRDGDPASAPTQFAEARDRLVDLGLPPLRLWHEPGDRPAVAGDDDGFAALDVVEDLRQMRLRFRGLDLSHIRAIFDWPIRLVET